MNRSPYWHGPGRQCARCEDYLPLEAFGPSQGTQDGLSSWCRPCHVTATREWRARNRKTINAKKRKAWRERRDEVNARRRTLYATTMRRSA